MYLRATPASIDPTLPGSTRRQQISVRPASKDPASRPPTPPSKRAPERIPTRPMLGSREEAGRRDPRLEPTPPGMRLPRVRPRPAMVVSPVSLTPEQLALPPGARPKMQTLLGLGAAVGEVLAADGSDAAPLAPREEEHGLIVTATGAATPAPAPDAAEAEELAPAGDEVSGVPRHSVELLADFALKLALGPISSSWAAEAGHAAAALLPAAERRQQAALGAVLARLLELLPVSAAAHSPAAVALDGALREQLVHEVSRLAGLLPEWPAPAQDLAEEARRREGRIVRELLSSVDGTRSDQRARLERQARLDVLGNMSAEALAQELGAPVERGRELRRVVDVYLAERQASTPDIGNQRGLGRALEVLDLAARAFEEADPELKDEQRALRASRRDAMTVVNLLLAERGEHEWLDLLEPLSIGERIERLKQWLSAAAASDGVEGPSRG
ncbi:MAG TPA: hypothetical protein VNN80_24610 [Polyangiaceae bacterium]|nr:hypothetical protein [Polyangiaceae bacterium]